MIQILEGLQPKQKVAIEEIGFDSLLQLRCTKIDHGLCFWLVNNLNPYSYTLEVYNTYIKFLEMDVEFILGLKEKGLIIDMNTNISNENDLCGKYYDKKGRLPLVILENQIREDINGSNDFKVRFVLFVLVHNETFC